MKLVIFILSIGVALAARPIVFQECFSTLGRVLNTTYAERDENSEEKSYNFADTSKNITELTFLISNLSSLNKTCDSFFKILDESSMSRGLIKYYHQAVNDAKARSEELRSIFELQQNQASRADLVREKSVDIGNNLKKALQYISKTVYYRYDFVIAKLCQRELENFSSRQFDRYTPIKYMAFLYRTVQDCATQGSLTKVPKHLN
eukprot:TRINITY_DN1118_c0_g1_i8.p1 TRINITY_DN1118_c0_g1~~TRINITY_DN1118_c0_g1_i8.p1  ORF type:complete len:205 (-),score=14.41 TRINITY_DN1118_c0_g1_i8:127-741(-)